MTDMHGLQVAHLKFAELVDEANLKMGAFKSANWITFCGPFMKCAICGTLEAEMEEASFEYIDILYRSSQTKHSSRI